MDDKLHKWRLILGKASDPEGEAAPLQGTSKGMDDVLEALYNTDRKGGLGPSSPNVNRWLGDIRKYFPTPVVQVMQKDALERLNLKKILMEPELLQLVEPDVNLAVTLLTLSKVMPEKTKDAARMVVRKVVEELEKKLRNPLRQAVLGALSRSTSNRRPRLREIDWHRTIRRNLKNYQVSLRAVIPERFYGHGRRGQSLRQVLLLVDQSGSMANSVVYAGVLGAILASIRSIRTHFIAFDTAVVDLTEHMEDPVELLFGVQLGGGTDIARAMAYAQGLVRQPSDTIMILLSDLFEGGNPAKMLQLAASLKASGVNLIALLALDDQGAPSYDKDNAAKMTSLGIPVFACTPDQFPSLMEQAINNKEVKPLSA
ncbi:MAG: hypothetical protein RI973_737 [Bacteroidota bacterium]